MGEAWVQVLSENNCFSQLFLFPVFDFDDLCKVINFSSRCESQQNSQNEQISCCSAVARGQYCPAQQAAMKEAGTVDTPVIIRQ